MRRPLRSAVGLVILWSWLAQGAPARVAAQAINQRPAVLVLFGDDPSQPWIQPMSDAISRVLYSRGAESPEPYYEYLDAVRFPDQAHRDLFRDTLRRKYAGIRFSLIVPVAGSAMQSVNEMRDELWPGVPVLFTRYNASQPLAVPVREHDVVLGFEFSLQAALETIKAVVPGTTHVAVAWDEDMAGNAQTSEPSPEFRRLDLQTINLNGLPLNEVVSRLGRLPDHAVVILGVSSGQLDAGHWMNLAWPLCETASSAANRPTFMLGAHFLGCGVVGGLLRDFSAIGRILGERALATLSGQQAANEVIPLAQFTELAFDARQLERWHIDEGSLPAGSVVRFRQPSLWRDFRLQVFGTALAIGVLMLLVGGLLYERRERQKAERDSRRNLALAADASRRETMSALTSSIAHELGQPLSSMIHNAQAGRMMINVNRLTPEAMAEILSDIEHQGVQASEIIDRHRRMLRSHQLDKKPIDVHAVIHDSLALVAHDMSVRQIEAVVRQSPEPCIITGDPVLLQQVLVNLVMNAMDAMAETPPVRRRVTIATEVKAAAVDISVHDAGTGVPAQVNGTLFTPFVTTKTYGLGIGLTITRTIVEAHGGTIEARNNPEGGATFTVTLPRSETATRRAGPQSAA